MSKPGREVMWMSDGQQREGSGDRCVAQLCGQVKLFAQSSGPRLHVRANQQRRRGGEERPRFAVAWMSMDGALAESGFDGERGRAGS